MEKTIAPYKGLTISISIKDGNLSIIGDAGLSCGQIHDSISTTPRKWNEGWSHQKLMELIKIWKRWHLNDMRAGSPTQEAALRQANFHEGYVKALDLLEKRNLNPDRGHLIDGKPYQYGTRWLKEELPPHIIEFLEAL